MNRIPAWAIIFGCCVGAAALQGAAGVAGTMVGLTNLEAPTPQMMILDGLSDR